MKDLLLRARLVVRILNTGSFSNYDRTTARTHEFAYLAMKKYYFAGLAHAFYISGHFADVLVLSTT